MKVQVLSHAALLLVGATLAYLAWNADEASGEATTVTLAQLEEKDLEEVKLTWPDGEVTVRPLRAGEETTWAATLSYDEVQKKEPAEKGEAEKDTAASDETSDDAGTSEEQAKPEPEKVRVTSVFPGGRSLGRALDALTPLEARRSLGKVAEDRLAAMELNDPARTLTVTAKGGKKWTFEVGAATYGDQGRYARLAGRDDVILLDSSIVRGLEGSPARLMEPRLVTLESEAVAGMKVRAGEREASFTHMERDQPKKRHFVHAGGEGQRSDEAAGLLSTLRGLRASKFVDKSALDGAAVRASVSLQRDKGEPLVVTLYEIEGGSDFLVQAGPWIGEVAASRGKNLLDDITAALPAE